MAFRFRKSISLFPGVRVNLGKKGIGISAGVKGARVGVNSKGTYTSVGIPGTGISSLNYAKKGKKQTQNVTTQKVNGNTLVGFLFVAGVITVIFQPIVGSILILGSLVLGQVFKNKREAEQAKNPKE